MYCEFIDKLFLHIRFQWVWNITVKSIKHFEQSLNIFYTIYIYIYIEFDDSDFDFDLR